MAACPIVSDPEWSALNKETQDLRESYERYIENGFEIDAKKMWRGDISDYESIYEKKHSLETTVEDRFNLRNSNGEPKRWDKKNALARRTQINDDLAGSEYTAVMKPRTSNGVTTYSIEIQLNLPKENLSSKLDNSLNNKLKEWLTKFGIQVKYLDDLQNIAGDKKAVAVANLLSKIIYVSNNLESATTLPEETAHFAVELLGNDNPYIIRLMELIPYTQAYKDVRDQYKGVYETETQFRKEAIGKLLAEHIIKGGIKDSSVAERIRRVLTKLWNDFLQIFHLSDPQSFQREIDAMLSDISNDIHTGEDIGFDTDNLPAGMFYQLDRDIKSQQKILEEAIENDYKRYKILKSRGYEGSAERQRQILNKIEKNFNDKKYKLGLFNFTRGAAQELRAVKNEINGLSLNDDVKEIAKVLRRANSYISSFSPILKDIKDSLDEEGVNTSFAKDIGDIRKDIAALEEYIDDVSIPLLEKVLKPFAVKSDGSSINIKTALKYLTEDISFKQRYLDAIAECSDDVLKITDKLVKEHKEKARLESLDDSKDLIGAKIALEKIGISSAKFVYERDHAGNITGNLLTKFNRGQWEQDRKNFFEALNASPEFAEWKGRPPVGTVARQHYNAAVNEWFTENTQPKPELEKIMAKKKLELINEHGATDGLRLYQEWYANNVGEYYTPDGNIEVFYKKDLSDPSDKYINTAWKEIYDENDKVLDNDVSKAKDKFLKLVWDKKIKAESKLPEKYRNKYLAPQLRKSAFERLIGSKNKLHDLTELAKEQVVRNQNDIDFGLKLTNEEGEPISLLPIYYVKRLPNANDMSLDIVASMSAYSHMANDYSEMNKIVDILELENDVLKKRQVGNSQFGALSYFGKKQPIVKPGEASYAYQRFQDYLNMVIYGEYKKDEGSVNIFGTEIDKAKAIDLFGRYVSLSNMALNLYSGISNITYGSIQARIEAAAKEYFDHGDLMWADATYSKNLPGIIGGLGQRMHTDKMGVWGEYANVFQDFENDLMDNESENKTVAGQLFKTSSLYFTNKAGEHWMQLRTSLALAKTVKLKDSSGKVISLWDAADVKDGKLVFKDGLTIVADGKTFKDNDNGKPFTDAEFRRFINKQNFINKRLHGIYNRVDRGAVQQYALGRLAIMFRKFMSPGFNRRFEKLGYNYEGETYTEGYYNTTWRFFKQLAYDLKKAQFKLGARFNELQDFEKKNLIRMATEVGYMLASLALISAVSTMTGDDDDDWLANMTAYQANRLYTELRFYSSVEQGLKILASPAAGIDQLQKVLNFIQVHHWGEEIEKGKYKGYTKFEKGLIETIPLVSTYNKFLTPEEQLQYFKK